MVLLHVIIFHLSFTIFCIEVEILEDRTLWIRRLNMVRSAYKAARVSLDSILKNIQDLHQEYDSALLKMKELHQESDNGCQQTAKAQKVLSALMKESGRWEECANKFWAKIENVVGDVLLSAAHVAYSGAMTWEARRTFQESWMKVLDQVTKRAHPQCSVHSRTKVKSFNMEHKCAIERSQLHFPTSQLMRIKSNSRIRAVVVINSSKNKQSKTSPSSSGFPTLHVMRVSTVDPELLILDHFRKT